MITDNKQYHLENENEKLLLISEEACDIIKIIEQPNDFAKIVKRISQDKGMNESQGCRLEFWTQFNDILEQRGKPFNKRKATTDHWYSVAVGSSECQISIDLVNKEHKMVIENFSSK